MKFHEYANLFPMMPEMDLMRLAEDIKEKGQSDPVITLDGMILDGRNRYRACEINGITPRCEEYSGDDPLGFVISHNLQRRHLSESQRTMVAAKWAGLKLGANQHIKEGPPIGEPSKPSATKTRDEASQLLNVGTSSIDRAKKVIKEAPELIDKIESGEMSVNAAYVTVKTSVGEESKPIVADESKGDGNNPKKKLQKIIFADGNDFASRAKSQLERITKQDKQRVEALTMIMEYCKNRLDNKK
jgi:ParB-like chromosome segregation protein Spo0J